MIPAMPSRSSWSRRCMSNMMLVDGTLVARLSRRRAQTASAPAGLVGSKVAFRELGRPRSDHGLLGQRNARSTAHSGENSHFFALADAVNRVRAAERGFFRKRRPLSANIGVYSPPLLSRNTARKPIPDRIVKISETPVQLSASSLQQC